MYLKKLSVQGFKSFANRTSFDFDGGVTAVVGPNGSGKSNVADAIRWVLGEQSVRLLRAKRADDVIFSGTSQRAATGMAEVLLTLDNSDRWLPLDFAEVEVGRRVYRNGDSEYLLNGSRVRLRDIADLLMKGDVGQNSYTIMGQGLVDEVLSMSPEDRRVFLDEAADVKRFRVKIQEAQNRLAQTRDNIERVTLVVAEIEPRLAQLSRQAERASEHRKLIGELTELLRVYYSARWSDAQNSVVRARAALDQTHAEGAAASDQVDRLREQLRGLSEELRNRRDAISRRETRNAEFEGRIAAVEQNIALDHERASMTANRREELRLEIETLEAERTNLAASGADEGRRGEDVAVQLEEMKTFVSQCREGLELAEREYAAARSTAQELRDGAEADDRRLAVSQSEVQRASQRVTELDRESEQFGPRRRQLLGELRAYGRRYAEIRESVIEAETELHSARAAAENARQRLARVQDEVRLYESGGNKDLRELDHLEGRLDALRRVQAEHDGVAAGTRSALIMGQALMDDVRPGTLGEPPEVAGVLGLLARQLKVPAGLEVAVNAALEQRLHAVVVESEDSALKAIELLSRRRNGRAQFLAMDQLRHVYPLNLQKEKGVIGVASKLVKCEKRMQQLVDTLLGRVIIVEDVPTGLRMIRRSLGSCVTADGVYIEATGIITGGATGADEGPFVRQRELEELPVRIEELKSRTAVSAHQLEQARAAIQQLGGRAREADVAYDGLRRDVEGGRNELERERARLHRLRRDMDQVRMRRVDIERDRQRQRTLIDQAEQTGAELSQRRDERRGGIAGAQAELAAATEKREAALRGVSEASGRLAAVEGERRALVAMREQHEKAVERLANQVSARKLQAKNLDLEAKAIAERLSRLATELETIRAARQAETGAEMPGRDELAALETRERQLQDDLSDAQQALLATDRRRLDLEAEIARSQTLMESLRDEMSREGLAPDRGGAVVPFEQLPLEAVGTAPVLQGAALVDIEAMRTRIEEVRRRIRRLGPINAEAPEDYRESKERHEFLTTQMTDLADAEAQLREAIAELTVEIKQRFGTAFTSVNKAFGEYFQAFFGGGTAQLVLTNPDNVGETGIEIEACPPGKRIKSLSLLSGGERSLTAVAMLFALLTVNPAPFVVLDEVDAALDEANVGRFTTALLKLAEKTQFIVITHNRRTVEVGDAIYGVTMGRDGVSKVLSLRLSDVPAE